MRMSCGGWAGGSNPGASPRRNSLAYRRYLRFLPSYSGPRERDPSETPNDKDPQDFMSPESEEIIDPYPKKEEHQEEEEEKEEKMIDLSSVAGEETLTTLVVEGDEAPRRRYPDDCSRRREKEILRERGLSRWLKDQEDVQTPTPQCHNMFADNGSEEEDKHRKDDADKPPDVVSVSSLVRQYTAMLNARNAPTSSSSSSLSPNALQTSRSCSSIVTKTNKFSRLYGPPTSANGGGSGRKEGRHSSIDSGDGDSSDGLLGSSRYRSFSLPWPSDTNWRWSSDPNIMANTAPQSQAVGQPTKPSGGDIINQHSNSLARLDSGTSDEGCPRDGSTGPTPPLSPVFRGLGPNHHLCGLITPFKSLSPASSMGSHLGSVEDIPLSRSMSFGHVIDRLIRSRSADSAVEVEEDSRLPSSAATTSQQQQQQQKQQEQGQQEAIQDGEKIIRVTKSEGDVGVLGDVEDRGNVCGECGEIKQTVSASVKCCDIGGQCEVISGGGGLLGALPNGDIPSDEGHSSEEVFCDCGTECGESCDHRRGDGDLPEEEVPVELRRKERKGYGGRRERRCGEVDGDMLLRRARGCGAVAGTGVFQDIADDSDRKVLRTPSVVISDHSGDTVSLTVALASSDFSIEKLDDKFQPPPSVSPASSSPSLCVGDDASRKVSSCSSCSSVSTVDMTTPLTPMLTPGLDSLMEIPNRRISDCSTASNVSISEEEMEQPLPRPPPPKKQSNWRKVRNIVQWTPFIQTYKKHKYPWVQLAGHQGNFKAGYKQGTILKKLCPPEEKALGAIMKDILRPYVPQFMGVVEGIDGEKYLQLQDLLSDFELPCVMDIKMGVRTYLEDELAKAREKPKLRKDMYEKMVQIDPKAPTEAEHRAKAVTKPRYMVWRETISSTATQGFRIEGVRRGDGTSSKDFKTTRTREQVLSALRSFLQGYSNAASRYVQQLKSIKVTLEASPFFNSHELIGSSLLFVHNDMSATVRMIDFAKTIPLPENVHITHRSPWSEGTHEDGYLLGLDNLIDLFSSVEKSMSSNESSKTGVQNSSVQEQTNSSSSSIINDATPESKGPDSSSKGSATTTPTTISNPLPSVNNHTPVPVNASLT